MRLALLQPQFAPNLFDLASMLRAEKVIWLDKTRWSRKGRSSRALIRIQESTQWINIPIVTEDKKKPICDVRIDQHQNWFTPLWNALEYNYRNSVYFDYYEHEIRADFEKGFQIEKLVDFNTYFFQRLCAYLELSIDIEFESSLVTILTDPDEFSLSLGFEHHYMEHDSRNYLRQGSQIEPAITKHPEYRQHFGNFIEGCSILDLLFECGPESFRVLDKISLQE